MQAMWVIDSWFGIKGGIMAHTHHLHFFPQVWLDRHSHLLGWLKRFGIPLGVIALLAISVGLITQLELNLPMTIAMAVDVAGDASESATGYLPDQFVRQAHQAEIEELPPQF